MASLNKSDSTEKIQPLAGFLAWLVPGAGHWYTGYKKHGVIIFVTITTTFVLGVMLGGIEMIGPQSSKPWFAAQILTGMPAIIGTLLESNNVSMGFGRGVDHGQVYTGVAGLLNLLCILDVLVFEKMSDESKEPGEGVIE